MSCFNSIFILRLSGLVLLSLFSSNLSFAWKKESHSFITENVTLETEEHKPIAEQKHLEVIFDIFFPDNIKPNQLISWGIFLHGKGGNKEWFADLKGPEALDQYVKNGGNPFAVVVIDGSTRDYYRRNNIYYRSKVNTEAADGYWLDAADIHDRFSNWGKLITFELPEQVKKFYPNLINPLSNAAGLMGISMGGQGVLNAYLRNSKNFNERIGFNAIMMGSPVFRTYDQAQETNAYEFGHSKEAFRKHSVPEMIEDLLMEIYANDLIPAYRPLPPYLYADMGNLDDFIDRSRICGNFLHQLKDRFQDTPHAFQFINKIGLEFGARHENPLWERKMHEYVKFMGDHLSQPIPLNIGNKLKRVRK